MPETWLRSTVCYRRDLGFRKRRGGALVVGLGVDLVELGRVAHSLDRWGHRFIDKLMEPEEASRLPPAGEERVRALSLAIAGKEAASKALGTGWSHGVRWRDVEVDLGPPPSVQLRGTAMESALRLGSTGRSQVALQIRGDLAIAEVRLLA